MCGIAGFSINERDLAKINSRNLANKLLLAIVARGEDATGAGWVEEHNGVKEVFYAKSPIPADLFVEQNDFMAKRTPTAILHTRYATKGSPKNNDNNHPIVIPDGVIGVHNGVIVNDDDLFEDHGWQRIGEVDSEAIFQLITNMEKPLDELETLKGRAAISWIDTKDPHTLHIARLTGSPLAIGHTYGESLIFASTRDLLKRAVCEAKINLREIWELPEMVYLKVRNGKIVKRQNLDSRPAEPTDFELFPIKKSSIPPYRHYSIRK